MPRHRLAALLGLPLLLAPPASSGVALPGRGPATTAGASFEPCCGPPGLVCSGPSFSEVVEEKLYFVHPLPTGNQTLGWGNHNLAAALGDAAFVCVDNMFIVKYNDTLISSVLMRWNASYSNYAECDDREGGDCIFGDGVGKGVGRVNPFFWPGKGTACGFDDGTQITGQCWRNLSAGIWYSFQKPGACLRGKDVGHAGCAWLPVGGGPAIKTIRMSCLLKHGLVRACSNNTLVPGIGCDYHASREILQRGFLSDDREAGGCANVSDALGVSFSHPS